MPKIDEAARLKETAPRLIGKLAAAQLAFEQSPDRETLGALAAQCTEAASATTGAPFKTVHSSIPGNAVQPVFRQPPPACSFWSVASARSASAASATDADGPERRARSAACLCPKLHEDVGAVAGRDDLPSRAAINGLERERDDKAHRFVVTSNAFLDGNKLAYLALAIALAIDGLILASGVLGALTMRSPLAAVRRPPAYSVADCEALIESALLPDVAYNRAKNARNHFANDVEGPDKRNRAGRTR